MLTGALSLCPLVDFCTVHSVVVVLHESPGAGEERAMPNVRGEEGIYWVLTLHEAYGGL